MAQARPGAAVAAVVLALLVVAPAVASLQGALDAFAVDLSSGEFRPFGKPFAGDDDARAVWDDAVGGLTGESNGGFTAGVANLPNAWPMDRDGAPGRVTIDYVFDPALGAMKRLKAFDRVGEDYAVEVADPSFRSAFTEGPSSVDTVFRGSFPVRVNPETPVPIFSPAPEARVLADSVVTDPPVGIRLLKDGADTFYVVSETYTGVVTLNLTYVAPRAYFMGGIPRGIHPDDYPASERPSAPEAARQRAPLVLARAGLDGTEDLAATLAGLATYFRGFGEQAIPQEDEVADLYEALALGGNGCCRHRAFAFVTTLHALGYPARMVVNEAHAFAEVKLPGKVAAWRQVNLGGCGSYEVNNPNEVSPYRGVGPHADAPTQRPSDEERADPTQVIPTLVSLAETPARLVKGEGFEVEGSVASVLNGRRSPLRDAPVDVYLNRTDAAGGVLVATGRTQLNGEFRLAGHLAPSLAPGDYALVVHARSFRLDQTLYTESWNAATADLWAATRLNLTVLDTEGLGVPVPVSGRLLDATDRGVSSANLTLVVDGTPSLALTTDRAGRFWTNLTFQALGLHAVSVEYAGDAHHGSARTGAEVRIVEAAVVVDAPSAAVRGEPWTFEGRVLSGARGVPGVSVTVHAPWLPDAHTVMTTAEGRFSGEVPVPAGASIGDARVSFLADPPGAGRELDVSVVHGTALRVDAPARVPIDEAVQLRVTVVAHRHPGDPVPVPEARVFLGLGNRAMPLRAATDAMGTATFTLDAERLGLEEGPLRWRLHYPGSGELAAADASGTLHVGAAPAGLTTLLAWAAGLGGPLLVGATAYAWRRRGAHVPVPAWARRLRERRPRVRLRVESPGRAGPLPPVWATGEPARLLVRGLRVRDGVATPADGLRVRGRVGDQRWRARLNDEGLAQIDLGPLPEGAHAVQLRAGRHRWAATLRVGPYGREIERAWLAARDAAGVAGRTPREVAKALADAGGDPEAADRAATLYEAAEYTQGDAGRDDYEAFLRDLHAATATSGGGSDDA